MNAENTFALFERYPRLYRGRTLSLQESRMSDGFACDDGWFNLIDRLSARIEAECARLVREEGWFEDQLPIASQVKEKLGSLRFYLSPRRLCYENETIHGAIEAARAESERTCELCGRPTALRRLDGWPRTQCDDCRKRLKGDDVPQ